MEQTAEKTEKTTGGPIGEMFKVGAHFAYSKARRHPSVTSYIFGVKNNVEIFDLEKTHELLEEAKTFVANIAQEKKQILFVAGKNEARDIVRNKALSVDLPFVVGRWIGGTLTNFDIIKKQIERFETLSSEKEQGELAKKYTKKEQLLLTREMTSLEETFGGLVSMKELPSALFIIDTKREEIAVKEARKKGIPVIGLMNSDCDASLVEYPILANDASMESITFFVNEIAESYSKNKNVLKKEEGTPEKK